MLARLLVCSCLLSPAAFPDLLIRNVTVVDVSAGTTRPKVSILIHGNQIAKIAAEIPETPGARVIDGSGKFAIPGLWDMHVHLSSRDQLSNYIANGITGVRDMGSDLDRVKQWRDEVQKGALLGPHIETCGALIDGFPAADLKIPVRVVRSPSEARSTFDRIDDQGVDFVGILPRLPRDAYFALAERARKYYLLVSGPVPATVSVLEAIDARQKTVEHMSGILLACSTDEKKLREPRSLALERNDVEGFRAAELAAMRSFSAEKADALFQRMALYGTRSVPTLVSVRSSPYEQGVYEMLEQLLDRMHRAGVVTLAGTDSGRGATQAAPALHQELQLLVEAGLKPAEALRAATIDPAKYLDADQSLGSIESGKIADLVLLDANPLADIANTKKIAAVIVGGKYQPALVAKSK